MKPRVLIIEDNDQNLYLATFLLEQKGLAVLAARNGLTGIEAARAEKPDVILMDIQMPELDGYEAVRRLKADPELRHIPVVAVSSFAMTGDRQKALALGCADYIEKPIDPDTFGDQVMKFLKPKGDAP